MKLAKKLVIAAAALPIALGSASAFAYGGGKGGHHGGKGMGGQCGGMDKRIMRQLDLTEEQKTQLKELRQQGREAGQANRSEKFAKMQAHQEKVQALVLADNFDQQAAQELANEMVAQRSEMKVTMLERQHQAMSILTAEQKTKFKQLQAERAQECQERFEDRQARNQ